MGSCPISWVKVVASNLTLPPFWGTGVRDGPLKVHHPQCLGGPAMFLQKDFISFGSIQYRNELSREWIIYHFLIFKACGFLPMSNLKCSKWHSLINLSLKNELWWHNLRWLYLSDSPSFFLYWPAGIMQATLGLAWSLRFKMMILQNKAGTGVSTRAKWAAPDQKSSEELLYLLKPQCVLCTNSVADLVNVFAQLCCTWTWLVKTTMIVVFRYCYTVLWEGFFGQAIICFYSACIM